ncbi:MAG: LamG domain-containing protein [Candidatus Eremiobacteraeota bacterium]|nr:LamG domain-containing protein [Candidatus Eremiobacteraeota bacterium]
MAKNNRYKTFKVGALISLVSIIFICFFFMAVGCTKEERPDAPPVVITMKPEPESTVTKTSPAGSPGMTQSASMETTPVKKPGKKKKNLGKVKKGLIAYYSFDDKDAYDDSGKGHHGIIMGTPSFVRGVKGLGLQFKGDIDENVTIPDFPALKRRLTLSLWVKPKDISLPDAAVISKACGSKEPWCLFVGYNGTRLVLNGKFAEGILYSKLKVHDGKFSHVVASYDYNTGAMWLYKDGKFIGGSRFREMLGDSPGKLNLASSYPGGKEYFSGVMDEVRIYNRALSKKEVKELYEEVVKR